MNIKRGRFSNNDSTYKRVFNFIYNSNFLGTKHGITIYIVYKKKYLQCTR